MKRKGYNFKLAKHLGFRMGNPEKDVDTYGEPIPNNYVVIVKIKDCETYTKDGKDFYNPANASQHGSHSYSRTNMVYGKPRKRKDFGEIRYTQPIYWVEDAKVYQATRTVTKETYEKYRTMTPQITK